LVFSHKISGYTRREFLDYFYRPAYSRRDLKEKNRVSGSGEELILQRMVSWNQSEQDQFLDGTAYGRPAASSRLF
jgi:hypothetical protein